MSGQGAHWTVLLAHGSRDARWRQPFEALQRTLGQELGGPVALAYLQFCEPTLEQVLTRARADGALHATVVPLFMSGGGHLLRDVPDAVREAARACQLQVTVTGALAEEPEVARAMVQAVKRLCQQGAG